MDRAIGVSPEKSADENQSAMNAFFNKEHPDYQRKQLVIQGAQTVLDREFCALGTEMGWSYPSLDTKNQGYSSGQIREDGEFDNLNYHPSTIPGHHLPHLSLQRENIIISSRDLLQRQQLLLLAMLP